MPRRSDQLGLFGPPPASPVATVPNPHTPSKVAGKSERKASAGYYPREIPEPTAKELYDAYMRRWHPEEVAHG